MTDALVRLRAELQELHVQAFKPSHREIEKRSGGRITHPTVAAVLRCEKLHRWEVVALVVDALGGDRRHFTQLWTAACRATAPNGGRTPPPPAPGDGAPQSRGWDVFDLASVQRQLGMSPRYLMRSLTELRWAIEPMAAFLAAERFTDAESAELVELARTLQDIGSNRVFAESTAEGEACRERYRHVDAQFHTAVLTGCRNEFFRELDGHVRVALDYRILHDRLGTGGNKPFPEAPTTLAMWFHRALAAAVRQGRCSAAETFSRAILAEIREGPLPESVALQLGPALDQLDRSRWSQFAAEIDRLLESQTWPGR